MSMPQCFRPRAANAIVEEKDLLNEDACMLDTEDCEK